MELTESNVQIRNCSIDFIPVYIKQENEDREEDLQDVQIISAAQQFCAAEVQENNKSAKSVKERELIQATQGSLEHGVLPLYSTVNIISQNDLYAINSMFNSLIYIQTLDYKNMNLGTQPQKASHQLTEVFINNNEPIQMAGYNISAVTIPSEFLGINLNIKKEDDANQGTVYTAEWLCNSNDASDLQLKFHKNTTQTLDIATNPEVIITTSEDNIATTSEASVIPVIKQKDQITERIDHCEHNEEKQLEKSRRRIRVRSGGLQDYKERLRRKAECMREKRKKLYEQETQEQRQQRLAKEAAKRREMRMYYETPEQRRKRLDAEAARKREYRMYNETPEDRRRRLDREAERRRLKRLSLYASETPEQRRERLNKESAKRREARLNQYAKETQEERKERLRRDALRVREMRFTRSAIETEEERRQRLVKDALRKREVRMNGSHSVNNNFTELQTVRNFEELNSVEMKENPDNQLGGHYLSNWMMWFQNTLTQPVHIGEPVTKCQTQNSE